MLLQQPIIELACRIRLRKHNPFFPESTEGGVRVLHTYICTGTHTNMVEFGLEMYYCHMEIEFGVAAAINICD